MYVSIFENTNDEVLLITRRQVYCSIIVYCFQETSIKTYVVLYALLNFCQSNVKPMQPNITMDLYWELAKHSLILQILWS
jgi:hypothetical protein